MIVAGVNSLKRHILTQHHASSSEDDTNNVSSSNIDEGPTSSVIEYLNVEPLPEDSSSNDRYEDAVSSQEIFDKALSLFIAGLYANDFLPRNVVQTIFDGFKRCVSSAFLIAIKNTLLNISANEIRYTQFL